MLRKIFPDVLYEEQTLVDLPTSATVREAVAQMTEHGIGAVFVTENHKLCGIFTERDVTTRVVHSGLNPDLTLLQEVMTTNPDTLSPDASVQDALQLMQSRKCRHLPVIKNDRIVGMVSIRDLFSVINRQLEQDVRDREEFIFGSGYSAAP